MTDKLKVTLILITTDDTQLYLSFSSLDGDDQVSSVAQIESCVRDIDLWMACNKLKLNRDKTELLVIGSKHRPCPSLDGILVGDCCVHPSDTARDIGVVFYQTLSLDKHVNLICILPCFIYGILLRLGST